MIDHLSVAVSDLERSIGFYDAVFAALGISRLWTSSDGAGYGYGGTDEPFAIRQHAAERCAREQHLGHVAFSARNRTEVRAFHDRALAHGGTIDAPPSLHPAYGPGYFATFVQDPDGHRLEAVFHETVSRSDCDPPAAD